MKALARSVLSRLSPRTLAAVTAARARAHSQRLVKSWGLTAINRTLIHSVGSTIQSGPFQGLRLPEMAHAEHVGPYLLGTYELELHPWWNDLLSRDFDLIVDVGAQFGYYAVGLARRYPRASVVAFDTDWWARRATARTAAANGVTNVVIRSYCTPGWLAAHVRPRSLILSDCEGFERELFRGDAIPSLKTAAIVIELHEDVVPGVTEAILETFRTTHRCSLVASRSATHVSLQVEGLTPSEINRAAAEVRSPQQWIYLDPTRP